MYNSILSAAGMSQSGMEVFVLGMIAVLLLGFVIVMYWPFIVAGGLAVFCVMVLANHADTPVRPVERLAPSTPIIEDAVAKPIEKEFKTEPFDEAKAFLEDCLNLTDYSKKQCQKIWNNRGDEEVIATDPAVFKLLDVDNKEYKRRRAEALKKQNAVVAHYTVR